MVATAAAALFCVNSVAMCSSHRALRSGKLSSSATRRKAGGRLGKAGGGAKRSAGKGAGDWRQRAHPAVPRCC